MSEAEAGGILGAMRRVGVMPRAIATRPVLTISMTP
jgi:hypothetical protein